MLHRNVLLGFQFYINLDASIYHISYINFTLLKPLYCLNLHSEQVLQNDIQAHLPSVDSLNDVGQKMAAAESNLEVSVIKGRLEELNAKWEVLLDKSRNKRHGLEEALKEVSNGLIFPCTDRIKLIFINVKDCDQ